jgi:hypothetical protein
MKPNTALAFKYSAIASGASFSNIALQALILKAYAGFMAVELSIILATGLILPIKYILDKKYIFNFRADSVSHDAKHFGLYTFVSIFTVLIFWGTEYGFHMLFKTDAMRYTGGLLGLVLSFIAKYKLDKKFVF